jgi:hypothetical protein
MNGEEMQAFSRDPRALGLQTEGGRAKEQQPITYRRVCLPLVLKDQTIFEAKINWWTGHIACYMDAADSLNNVAFHETCIRASIAPQSRDEYVREVFAFLQRGHTMLDPQCTCRHGLSRERAMELGVPPDAAGRKDVVCLVERCKTRRSHEDIAKELNIERLDAKIRPTDTMTLLQALVRLAGLEETRHNEGNALLQNTMNNKKSCFLHSPLCCIRPSLSSVDDVVHAAQVMAPLPFSMDDKQTALFAPLLESKYATSVFILNKKQVFWKQPGMPQAHTDIQKLWHQQTLPHALQKAEALDKELRATGVLQPMQTRPAPFSAAEQTRMKKRKAAAPQPKSKQSICIIGMRT